MPNLPVNISARITKDELDALDRVAAQRGSSRNGMIRQLIRIAGELDTYKDVYDSVRRAMGRKVQKSEK